MCSQTLKPLPLLAILIATVLVFATTPALPVAAQVGDGQGSGQQDDVLIGFINAPTSVYHEPNAAASVLGTLEPGKLVAITHASGVWYQIVFAGSRDGHGWIRQADADIVDLEQRSTRSRTPTPTATATPAAQPVSAEPPSEIGDGTVLAVRLNARSTPGLEGSVLGQLSQGTRVQIMDRQENWLQVRYEDGPEGLAWVSSAFVQVDGEPEPQGSTEATTVSPLQGKLVFQVRSGGDIFLMNADGSGLRRLTTGLDPALSPDGQQVAFTRWDVPRGLYVIDVEGNNERRLIGENLIKSPTWSLDGRQVAFNQQRGGTDRFSFVFPGFGEFAIPEDPYWRLGVIGIDGSGRENLPDQLHSFNPTWHPRGILYAGKDGLHETQPNGETRPIYQSRQPIRIPSWSPDGRFIIATTEFHDHWEIIRLNADGSGLVRLTPTRDGSHSVAPAWSPDGASIAFLTDREGKWAIWVMNADGSNPRPLAPQALAAVDFQYDFNAERVMNWGP